MSVKKEGKPDAPRPSESTSSPLTLTPVAEVLEHFREGRPVLIVDDETRENEADITVATERLTPELVAFMQRRGRGLICVSISSERALALNLPLQTTNNNSRFRTPFAVSIDHRLVRDEGVTAASRCFTMKALLDPATKAGDLVAPGHVFPLIVHPLGVLGRQGQTEASYDLARLAGLAPSGVICELLKEDGSVARGAEVAAFSAVENIPITAVREIARYRAQHEIVVRQTAEAMLSTDFGVFRTVVFHDDTSGKEHLALVYGTPAAVQGAALVRLHSECLTGDVFGSRRCDCGPQLHRAMERIVGEGFGIVLYLRQEGRGIGLGNKFLAYALQDRGRDTVEANLELGFSADERDFIVGAKMLESLGISSVRLLTNNPAKVRSLELGGIAVERVPLEAGFDPCCAGYLRTKRRKLGHLLTAEDGGSS